MNSLERAEFDSQMGILCAAFDVPCTSERKEAYWIGLRDMPLSRFIHTIEFALTEEDWTRIPKPGQVWAISKRMRSSGPTKPTDDGFTGDAWDIQSNLFLLAHIRQQMAKDPKRYGRPASVKAMQSTSRETSPNADASPEFIANVHRLVAAKKSWAADMRDVAIGGQVNPAFQKACWYDYINRAESEMRT